MRIFAIMAAVALLGACTPSGPETPPASNGSAPVGAPAKPGGLLSGTVLDDKALFAAETAFNVPAQAYVSADSKGLLKPETKATLKPIMADLYGKLQLARAAHAMGDTATFNIQLSSLKSLSAKAMTFLKGN